MNITVKEAALEAFRNFAPMFGNSELVCRSHAERGSDNSGHHENLTP
ncbi:MULTISPECIES: hypothetical protein [unclassified Nostoc]|nr:MULTISPECIES: hypothetical protein [unclassified Nostoc]MDZ8127000.1 hypothetical protein [Nostoc sp. CmiVER01]MDZ8222283.1 hypothetical protein [Nostoc sp. ChiVER01]